MASVYGRRLKISIFGEPDGRGSGVVIDGFPAGMKVDLGLISSQLKRSAPDRWLSTSKVKSGTPNVVSGISDGYTNGFPICALIACDGSQDGDGEKPTHTARRGHADPYDRSEFGEHLSGSLAAPFVFAGALCMQYLSEHGISIGAHIKQILNVTDSELPIDVSREQLAALRKKELPTVDSMAGEAFATIISSVKNRGDSVGARLECAVVGLPSGLGESMFEGVEAELSRLVFAIPGVKAIAFGDGFDFCRLYGSQSGDSFEYRDGRVVTRSNRCGGVIDGMTTGMPLIFSVAIKPAPPCLSERTAVNAKPSVKEYRDPCIAIRAIPALESAAAIAFCQLMLESERKRS